MGHEQRMDFAEQIALKQRGFCIRSFFQLGLHQESKIKLRELKKNH